MGILNLDKLYQICAMGKNKQLSKKKGLKKALTTDSALKPAVLN